MGRIAEETLQNKIDELVERRNRIEEEVQELREDLAKLRGVAGIPRTLNDTVRSAYEVAPPRFETTFIRDYVRKVIPDVPQHSLNASILHVLREAGARQLHRGVGGKASTYQKPLKNLAEQLKSKGNGEPMP